MDRTAFGQQVRIRSEPVTGDFGLDDDGVMQQAVKQCGGDDRFAEHFAPFGEGTVEGEDYGTSKREQIHASMRYDVVKGFLLLW